MDSKPFVTIQENLRGVISVTLFIGFIYKYEGYINAKKRELPQ